MCVGQPVVIVEDHYGAKHTAGHHDHDTYMIHVCVGQPVVIVKDHDGADHTAGHHDHETYMLCVLASLW